VHPNPKTETSIQCAEQILRMYEESAHRPELDIEPESVLADLLADLHHWCDSTGVDWDSVIDCAKRFHLEEVGSQDGVSASVMRPPLPPLNLQGDYDGVLGHKTVEVTLGIYAHTLSTDDEDEAEPGAQL
jgi:hypothetical protein